MSKPTKRSPNVPQNQPQLQPSHLQFPVVGIGASAGGLQAVLRFFEHMPSDTGMAFVIIMHLSPRHESNADKIIQKVTRMPVMQVCKPVPIEKNKVYVISPAQHLSMNDGHLRVREAEPSAGGHASIDLFFRALADVHKSRAFCLVLSGTGSDGAVGLSRIKEQGGVTFAQSPDDAEYDGMPRSAISTGMVDLILPAVEMPQKLIEIWSNARRIHMPTANDPEIDAIEPATEEDAQAAEVALRDILKLLHRRTGHNFRHYKRATVLRRIERRMQVNAQPDLTAYLRLLTDEAREAQALLSDMLIGVTNFFRDREAFEALERDVIPKLFARDGQSDPTSEIRAWCAGCSTGEEAYSLAILLNDQARIDGSHVKLQVFATDIDERAIAIARAGVYPESILTDISPPRLRDNFNKEKGSYKIRKEVREKVLFADHSLLRDPPFTRLDIITCRNLLIYLDRDVQKQILQMFHFALKPGGYLFLGSSESADACSGLFVQVDKRNRIFQAKPSAQPARTVPELQTLIEPRLPRMNTALASGSRPQSMAEIHQQVLEQYAPPSVIVNPQADIVHMSDRAGQFLRYVGGTPSHNLLSLIKPELRLELRSILFQAGETGKSVEGRRVKVERQGGVFYVNMSARPFKEPLSGDEYMLVLFDEVEDSISEEARGSEDSRADAVLAQLEEELKRTKLQLQNTLEHSGVSHEELKASNEELQAINEELRSATEELETSKEELQSINEELITVNYELKMKVEETSQINDDLQNLIASTAIATVFVDRHLRIKWFTPTATDIFSMLPVDAGRSLLDITHRLEYGELAQDAAKVFSSLGTIEREVQSADGRWYIARILPYRTSEDHIEGAVLTFIDITARRAAEEETRAGEERMQLVADSTEDYAIIVLSKEGKITSWNKGAELAFGYTRDEVLGKPSDLLFVAEDREAGIPSEELRRARENRKAEDERWHVRKDGTRFYCSGIVNLIERDGVYGYVKIARDLTAKQRQEDARRVKLAESESTIQLKDEFFAVMSHELKHPLNLIQLNAELLGRLPDVKVAPMVFKAVETIRGAVGSQARIIDDLLDVSRVRTGKLKLQRSKMDLEEMLQRVHSVVSADEKHRSIALQIDEGARGALFLHADPTRVEQIIWNLINNALKFTPDDREVLIRASRDDANAKLEVVDSGEGIAPEFLDKVFDLFGQVETQHHRFHKEGLGIGLSLVRQLTQAHGGSVQVHSEGLGKGSTFTVWLPLHESTEEPTLCNEQVCSEGRLQALKVLLVDDSQAVLEVMQMLLEAEMADVSSFADPREALTAAQDGEYDLIISDVGMPHMDGYELINALRQLPHLHDVPAIALTGYGNPADAQNALNAGFNRHLGKPVSYDGLIEAIESLMSDEGAGPGG